MTAVKEYERIERDAAGRAPVEPLVLAAEGVTLGGKLPTVEIVAYSGGLMRVPGWGDVVIDLSGLDAAAGQVAILADHDSKRTGVVGHGSASIEGGKLIDRGLMEPPVPPNLLDGDLAVLGELVERRL